MLIRMGTIDEMELLWGKNGSPTQNYFVKGMEKENIEFWTIEEDENKDLVGELYIFWDSEDKDEADGLDRAYLCAFRIDQKYQGRGYGKALMERVLQRVGDKGFNEVTIGADNDDADRLSAMYKAWGFSELVKLTKVDHHYIDANGNATCYDEPYSVFLNKLK